MEGQKYRIHGDNGELFCMCEERGADLILMGKNTSLTLNSLLQKAIKHRDGGRMTRNTGSNIRRFGIDQEMTG